jgi:predicted dehydrogenase
MIQIGVLGCGMMGQTLAQAVAASGMGRVRAVFDVDPAKSAALAELHGAEAAASEEALLATDGLQAVIIALPTFLHRESVLKAAEAGKHIFLEKPMAFGLADCREMTAAVEKAGVTLMVGHVLRYFEPFRTITRWSGAGRFGKPLHGAIWRLERDYLRLAPWKGRRSLSGGYLYEVGAHELDWMRCLFGEPAAMQAVVQKAQPAEHEIEDIVSVQIQFDSGAAGSYLGGVGSPSTEYGFCLRYEKATVRSANAFDPQAVKVEWLGETGQEPTELDFEGADPFEAEICDWLANLNRGSQIPITGEDASRTVALIEAAYEGAR